MKEAMKPFTGATKQGGVAPNLRSQELNPDGQLLYYI